MEHIAGNQIVSGSGIDSSKISINHPPFTYNIEYDSYSNMTQIKAVHDTEFLMWSIVISNELSESTSNNYKITLDPDDIFIILNDYKNGKINDSICKITFPNGFKEIDVPIIIEIIHSMPYNKKYQDVKIIQLMPEKVSIDKRFDFKLNYLRNELLSKYDQLSSDCDTDNGDIISQINDLHLKDNAFEVDLNTCKTNITSLSTRLSTVETTLGTNNTNFTNLTTKLTSAETAINTNNTSLTNLINNLTARVIAIETKLALLTTLETNFNALKNEFNTFKTTCDTKYAPKT
jgi:hypothetical protein